MALTSGVSIAEQSDVHGPAGSVAFGSDVVVLANGNFVVQDPYYGPGQEGAVHLYSENGQRISTLTDTKGLVAGAGPTTVVVALSNGNFVVVNSAWDHGGLSNVGAVTWVSGSVGLNGAVSPSNSLVGTSSGDWVGSSVRPLTNGNFVVRSARWDRGPLLDVGAVTLVDGSTGMVGAVSAGNSLVGSSAGDMLGIEGVYALDGGAFVVCSPNWDDGGLVDVGAATWGDGQSGPVGEVTALNSLIGSTTGDEICANTSDGESVELLGGGNYLVRSPYWSNGNQPDAGAVTWGSGSIGVNGRVSAANSLVGTTTGDFVGLASVALLRNGNYVVVVPDWHNDAGVNVGATVWGSGATGARGSISVSSALHGRRAGDSGSLGVSALIGGNYVVSRPAWTNVAGVAVGAVTWASGATGTTGEVGEENSLVGGRRFDSVGEVVPLDNGHYVVVSRYWDSDSAADAGAITWRDGTASAPGIVSSANSIVGWRPSAGAESWGYSAIVPLVNGHYLIKSERWGPSAALNNTGAVTWADGTRASAGTITALNSIVGSTPGDFSGFRAVPLSTGNYVVAAPSWDYDSRPQAGAVTFAFGSGPTAAVVSPNNSLVGSSAGDRIGYYVTALPNGAYIAASGEWDNGSLNNVGAATWASGTSGIVGRVSPFNSLVGSIAGDELGDGYAEATSDGLYVMRNLILQQSSMPGAGAITLAPGDRAMTGEVSPSNSVIGAAAGGGILMVHRYDVARSRLLVGQPAANRVTLFRLPVDLLLAAGFE